jgi:hypothetical protein
MVVELSLLSIAVAVDLGTLEGFVSFVSVSRQDVVFLWTARGVRPVFKPTKALFHNGVCSILNLLSPLWLTF